MFMEDRAEWKGIRCYLSNVRHGAAHHSPAHMLNCVYCCCAEFLPSFVTNEVVCCMVESPMKNRAARANEDTRLAVPTVQYNY